MKPIWYVGITATFCGIAASLLLAISYRNGYEDGSHAIECTVSGPFNLQHPKEPQPEKL